MLTLNRLPSFDQACAGRRPDRAVDHSRRGIRADNYVQGSDQIQERALVVMHLGAATSTPWPRKTSMLSSLRYKNASSS